MKRLCTILFSSALLLGNAQTTDPNLWQEYLPYNDVHSIAIANDIVYGATEFSMFSYNRSDQSIKKYSKGLGINDFGVAKISYNTTSSKLIIGYTSGNIDLLSQEELVGQSAIKLSAIIGDKTIYDLYNENENVYISTGFGIVVLNTNTNEIVDTYIIGSGGAPLKINGVTTDANYIYAATDEGLKRANKSSAFLANSDNWSTVPTPHLTSPYAQVINFNNNIFLLYKPNITDPDTLYLFDGSNWNEFLPVQGNKLASITQNNSKLVVATSNDVWVFDESLSLAQSYLATNKLYTATIDANNELWIGGSFNQGIVHVKGGVTSTYKPIGPLERDAYSLSEIYDGIVFKASGGIVGSGGIPMYSLSGFSFFNGLNWKSYNRNNQQAFVGTGFTDFLYASVNPKNTAQIAATSYNLGGLFVVNGESIERYDESNSTLNLDAFTNRYNLADLAYDDNQNLWVVNSYSPKQLHVLTKEGEWSSFSFGSSVSTSLFSKILIDSRGYKWIVSPSGAGVIVFDDNKTPLDKSDDRFRVLQSGTGKGNLPTSDVWSIEEDLSGIVWIGTSEGPAAFFNAQNIFEESSGSDAQQILIQQDENTEILLGAERITAIEVDGANRKWFGTNNSGVFAYNTDDSRLIYKLTSDNSPLLSNTINDIKIDHEIGLVYIATTNGLLSFKAEATMPDNNFSDVYAYPNPVNPNYKGSIYINGLVLNTDCKVTDAQGNLVKELTSLGGQAAWDGTDLFGNSVKAGVYLVFLSSSDGSKTEVTKIMVLR